MKILHVVGARPNFMKVAPVLSALERRKGVEQVLVHTGQHYDANMSEIFFRQLELPDPDINLNVGSGTQAWQVAQIMLAFEPVVRTQAPDLVLVYGDINSTLAAALVSAKLHVPVGHVEAGLRSFDRSMPEEINRKLTDQISEFLFTPSEDGDQNLLHEGIDPSKIHRVGNVMIDTLARLLPAARARYSLLTERFGLHGPYGLVTLHRPSNVDDPERLDSIIEKLNEISCRIPLLFPVHPRTRERITDRLLEGIEPSLMFVEPQSYLDFLALMRRARLVITDSGGIQEETTYLGVPCFTLRKNTERPITLQLGTNRLVGDNPERLQQEVVDFINADRPLEYQVPPLWDGRAGERIANVLAPTDAK